MFLYNTKRYQGIKLNIKIPKKIGFGKISEITMKIKIKNQNHNFFEF